MSPTPAKPPRKSKTPRQRAEEALATAARIATRLEAHRDKLKSQLAAAQTEHEAAQRRLAYARQNPDLKTPERLTESDLADVDKVDAIGTPSTTNTPGGDA